VRPSSSPLDWDEDALFALAASIVIAWLVLRALTHRPRARAVQQAQPAAFPADALRRFSLGDDNVERTPAPDDQQRNQGRVPVEQPAITPSSGKHLTRSVGKWRPIDLMLVACALSICGVAGCATRVGNFTMVSTKNYVPEAKYKLVGRMEGTDMVPIVLFIPFGKSDLDAAVDHCAERGNGVYVANAVVESTYWTAILFGGAGYRVTGDVYAPVAAAERNDPGGDKFESREEGRAKSDHAFDVRRRSSGPPPAARSGASFHASRDAIEGHHLAPHKSIVWAVSHVTAVTSGRATRTETERSRQASASGGFGCGT
jgi:hypothetical protein